MMQNDGAGFLSGAAGGFFGSLGATAWGGAGGKWQGIAGKYAGSDVGTIAFGALSGGVGAELSGGNFWQGAITGGIVAGLNDVMHKIVSFESAKSEESKSSMFYPDPKSFSFKTKRGWQESVVKGLYFNVALVKIGANGIKINYDFIQTFPQAIQFTVPTNLTVGNTYITNEVASQATAKIVNRVMSKTASLFAGTEATPMQIEQYFRTELKREYQMSIRLLQLPLNMNNNYD
jgi:hypothetical protein